jgi:hypothetical protein
MKKIIRIPILLIACIAIFASCKKSSGTPTSSAIVGTWELKSSHVVEVDSFYSLTPIVADSVYTHGHTVVFVFNNDKSYTEIDHSTTPSNTISAGTYSLDPTLGNITLVSSTVNETDQYNITGNTLTISTAISIPSIESVTGALVFGKE